jgi:hypothetical protein
MDSQMNGSMPPGHYPPGHFTPSRAGSRMEEVFSEHGGPVHPGQPLDGSVYPEQILPDGVPLSDEMVDINGNPIPSVAPSYAGSFVGGPPSTYGRRSSSVHGRSPYSSHHGMPITPANSLIQSQPVDGMDPFHRSRSRSRSRHSTYHPFSHRSRSHYDDGDEGDIVLMVDDNAEIEVRSESQCTHKSGLNSSIDRNRTAWHDAIWRVSSITRWGSTRGSILLCHTSRNACYFPR